MPASPGLTQCPVCEYELSGLPSAHQCPECGFEYDESTLVYYGTRTGRSPTIFLIPLFIYIAVVTLLAGHAFVSLGLVAATVYVVWENVRNRRRFKARGGKSQLLVCAGGVSLREGAGPPDLVPWGLIRRYRLRRYYLAGLSWRKPLPTSWHISFSSGSLFDPMRRTGQMPPRIRGRVYLEIIIDCPRAEADRLGRLLQGLFEASRPTAVSRPADG